jgi:DNA end-binding protein Ku
VPDNNDIDNEENASSFWSGTITFGLVAVPVNFYAANRPGTVSLRMIDKKGVQLSRRYLCPRENKIIDRDEIVRGYEIEDGTFVIVEDEELDSLEPEKSKEIDLRKFVTIDQINPLYFQRAYYLAPGGGSTKAYRLLAENLERTRRAGIATFVMRGREHIIAITAEEGILQAGTLRFHDEIRSPEEIGLPDLANSTSDKVDTMREEIRKNTKGTFNGAELRDRHAQRIRELAEEKIRSGKDFVSEEKIPVSEKSEAVEGPVIIDLMEVIQRRLQRSQQDPSAAGTTGKRKSTGGRDADLINKSRSELYGIARKLKIAGRSTMSKKELADSISRAS